MTRASSSQARRRSGERAHKDLGTVDALAQLSFLIHGTLERLAAEHGVSMVQARLLGILRDREPTMNELAQLLGSEKSSVTGLVDRAEDRGLVARIPSPNDGRSFTVALTDRGRALVADVGAQFEEAVAAFLLPLRRAERTSLAGLLSRVLVAHASARGVDLFAGAN